MKFDMDFYQQKFEEKLKEAGVTVQNASATDLESLFECVSKNNDFLYIKIDDIWFPVFGTAYGSYEGLSVWCPIKLGKPVHISGYLGESKWNQYSEMDFNVTPLDKPEVNINIDRVPDAADVVMLRDLFEEYGWLSTFESVIEVLDKVSKVKCLP